MSRGVGGPPIAAGWLPSRFRASVRPTNMRQVSLLIAVAALGTSGCSGSKSGAAAKPGSTVEVSGTAAAPAGSTEPVAAASTAKTAEATPTPPLPEPLSKALVTYAAALEKHYASLLADGGDCKKLTATVTAFASDRANATTCQRYFAEEAKLTPAQRSSLAEHPTTLKLLDGLGKTTEAHLKCTHDPSDKKLYGAALGKMEAMCSRAAAAPASSGDAPPGTLELPCRERVVVGVGPRCRCRSATTVGRAHWAISFALLATAPTGSFTSFAATDLAAAASHTTSDSSA